MGEKGCWERRGTFPNEGEGQAEMPKGPSINEVRKIMIIPLLPGFGSDLQQEIEATL